MSPKEIIEKWVEAFNSGKADDVAEFYSQDAINHQVAETPVHGKDAIRAMFAKEFKQADMTCIIENIFEDGDWAI
jgi:ketosteroid isomerase-like protein